MAPFCMKKHPKSMISGQITDKAYLALEIGFVSDLKQPEWVAFFLCCTALIDTMLKKSIKSRFFELFEVF